MIKTVMLIGALLCAGNVAAACRTGDSADDAIAHLLDRVRTTDAVFIRNGRSYAGARAARHIERKYEYLRAQIATPDDFIRLAATRSERSGQPYRIRLADGREMASAAWLRQMLAEFERDCRRTVAP